MSISYNVRPPEKETSQVFSDTLEMLIKADPKVVYLDADLMGSMKTSPLWRAYPKNVFNTGIQEANMVGVAAGLYLAGYKPYIHSFSPFMSRRVYDQVFISIAYGGKSVRLIGSDAGITATFNGGTHMCFEDISLMLSIPGACIVDVSDGQMFAALLEATKERPGVTYFRTPRRGLQDVYVKDTVFEVGKGKVLRDGSDVTIVASGIMLATAIEASEELARQGIGARVVDPITVKPLDEALILRCAEETGAFVTAENHNIIGGLGSTIATFLAENHPVPVLRLGVKDTFGQVGNERFLRRIYGLQTEDIVDKAKKTIAKKMRKGSYEND